MYTKKIDVIRLRLFVIQIFCFYHFSQGILHSFYIFIFFYAKIQGLPHCVFFTLVRQALSYYKYNGRLCYYSSVKVNFADDVTERLIVKQMNRRSQKDKQILIGTDEIPVFIQYMVRCHSVNSCHVILAVLLFPFIINCFSPNLINPINHCTFLICKVRKALTGIIFLVIYSVAIAILGTIRF